MDKEQLQNSLDEIDILTDSITRTIDYLEWCLVEILKQKEQINRQLTSLSKKKTKIGFTTNNTDENKDV